MGFNKNEGTEVKKNDIFSLQKLHSSVSETL